MKGPIFAAMISAAAAIQSSSTHASSGHASSSHASSVHHSSSHHSSSLGPKQTNAPDPFELKVLAEKKEADLEGTFAGEMNKPNPALHGEPLPKAAAQPVALVKPGKREHQSKHTSGKAESTGKPHTSTMSAHTSSKSHSSGKAEPTNKSETSKVLHFELVNGALEVHTSDKHENGTESAKTYVSFGKQDKDTGMVAVNLGGAPVQGFHLKPLPQSAYHSSSGHHGTSTMHKPTTTMMKVPKGTGKTLNKKHHVACHNETGHEGTFYACPAKPVALPTGTALPSGTALPTGTALPKSYSKRQELEYTQPTNVPAPVEGHDLFVHFGDKAAAKDCQEIKLEVYRHEHKHTKTSSSGYPKQTSHSGYTTHASHSSHMSYPTHSSSSGRPSSSAGYPVQSGYPTQ